MPLGSHDTEVKLMLPSAEYYDALRRWLPPPRETIEQRNLFLDSPEGALSEQRYGLRARLELRLREPAALETPSCLDSAAASKGADSQSAGSEDSYAEESALLALKGPSRRVAGAIHRLDLEAPMDPALWHRIRKEGRVPLAQLKGPAARQAAALLPSEAVLRVRVAFDNRRSVHGVPLAGEARDLLLDRTAFATGEVDHEIEVEILLPEPPEDPRSSLLIHALRLDLKRLLGAASLVAHTSSSGKLSRALAYQKQASLT